METQLKVLITGAAGFIGSYLAQRLVKNGYQVIGIDNMNDYYDVSLKEERLKSLEGDENFRFEKTDIADADVMRDLFAEEQPELVVNLAAQAGVRYSITNPDSYIQSNIVGFYNILECCRHSGEDGRTKVKHLVYASSSSVYGANKKVPYSVEDPADHPVSLYAATKKSDELMAYAYSRLYGIPATGLRFFTVYGPKGRPDMAYFGFADKMARGQKIQIFNHGDMYRDFTYIDDVITGVESVMKKVPAEDENGVRHKVYNIGNHRPESLMHFVETLEQCLIKAGVISAPGEKEFLPMQPGDVYRTYADVTELERDFGFAPNTSLETGLQRFADWYAGYYLKK